MLKKIIIRHKTYCLTVHSFITDALPTRLNILQNGESLYINFTAEGSRYFIRSFSPHTNWTSTNDTSFTLNLINTNYDITVSLCPEMTNSVIFTIG